MGYIAFVLDEPSRTKLLRMWPTVHPDVICHHVTLLFGVPKSFIDTYGGFVQHPVVHVRGEVVDDKCQALIVSVNRSSDRSDGGIYHITHSIDRSKGAKPVYSNTLVSDKNKWELNRGVCFVTGTVQYFD